MVTGFFAICFSYSQSSFIFLSISSFLFFVCLINEQHEQFPDPPPSKILIKPASLLAIWETDRSHAVIEFAFYALAMIVIQTWRLPAFFLKRHVFLYNMLITMAIWNNMVIRWYISQPLLATNKPSIKSRLSLDFTLRINNHPFTNFVPQTCSKFDRTFKLIFCFSAHH